MQRPPTASIPDAPGSYQFLDADGRVLYVGKAKSLRHRITSYFQDPAALPVRTAQMVAQADHVEWVVVGTEVEALMLEHSLIQAHQPRFNVRLKDDKSYPWLAVTVGEEWPRPIVFRGKKRKGVRYFGPYGHVGALRETLDLLLRSFPVRTCSDAKFKRHERLGRPCLLYDIERCSGPCVGAVEPDRYRAMVEDLMHFLSGDTAAVVARLEAEMVEASEALEFERAARAARPARRRCARRPRPSRWSPSDPRTSTWWASPRTSSRRRSRCSTSARAGWSGGAARRRQGGGPVPGPAGRAGGRAALRRAGGRGPPPGARPRRARVDRGARGLAGGAPGRAGVGVGAPARRQAGAAGDGGAQRRRGPGPAPAATGRRPQQPRPGPHRAAGRPRARPGPAADRVLRHEPPPGHRLRGLDGGLRGRAGQEVRLPPVQGQDGRRQRRLRGHGGGAPPPAHRPLARSAGGTTTERRRRFAYPPQLLLLDGGKGQLGVGERVLAELGLEREIELAALAKQFEEVYRPGSPDPVRVPRGSPRRSTCSSGCATRPTASPSPTTASAGASG